MRCAILDDYQDVARSSADWSRLDDLLSVDVFRDYLEDEDALAARLAPYQIVVVMRERTPLAASLLDRLPDLRLVVTSGMRNASLDVEAASRNGVTVCGTSTNSEPPAELAWALILTLLRNLVAETRSLRSGGRWQSTIGRDLFGARLGLVGLGRVGTRMATVGIAFGMDVHAWSANLTDERAASIGVHRAASLDELLSDRDIVSVHLALSERTVGLIGRRELALMRPSALLINTSRSAIVDQSALADALRSGVIAGAGLDVFDTEPLAADDPIRTLPNLVATPHLGYVTQRNYADHFTQAVENIDAFLAGSPIREVR